MQSHPIFEQFASSLPKLRQMSRDEIEKFYAFGFSLYGAGSFEEAVDVFQVLCTQNPFKPKHWFALASSLQEARFYEKALSAWAMAAILSPSDPFAHFHAAECSFALGRKEDALAALQAALTRSEGQNVLQDRICLLQEQWNILCQTESSPQ